MKDEQNPEYIFRLVDTKLLVAICDLTYDGVELARKELANRGLNEEGNYVGFKGDAA
jgi:hypothetical protein